MFCCYVFIIYIYTPVYYIRWIHLRYLEIIQCGVYNAVQKHVAQHNIMQYSNTRESATEQYSIEGGGCPSYFLEGLLVRSRSVFLRVLRHPLIIHNLRTEMIAYQPTPSIRVPL